MVAILKKRSFLRIPHILLFITILFISNQSFSQKLVVGYYPNWLKSSLPTSKIQFNNLTHIIHSFAWPTASGGIEHYNGMLDPNLNSKVHEANKKILIAFGGAGLSDGFGPMAIDSSARTIFVNNVYDFLTANNYDGIDIDWEFPQNNNEKKGLTQLVKELREKFDSNNPSLLISMAVGASNWSGQHFEFEKMEDDIDWFAMMGYDISGSWSSTSGHNAPLFKGQNDWSWNDGYNYLHSTRSISNEKLLLGLPFYGKQFSAKGAFENFTGTVANLRYNEVMSKITSGSWGYFWDSKSKVPYLLDNDRTKFITYDDTSAVKAKVKYALEKNVAGVMIWALGQDIIGNSQPLLEMIDKTLNAATSIKRNNLEIPEVFNLYNNYPNPFNPSTTIKFDLIDAGKINLRIYNVTGELVKFIIKNEFLQQGQYTLNIRMDGYSSGVYFYQLQQRNSIITKKMSLVQ